MYNNISKLPRIPQCDKYVTGESQNWTSAYTWEDFNAAVKMYPHAENGTRESNLKEFIFGYFKNNPESLAANNISEIELRMRLRI